MTTLRDIVKRAMRVSGLIQVGTDPEADEFEEAFYLLTTIINSLFGKEFGENLEPVNYGSFGLNSTKFDLDYKTEIDQTFVPANVKLFANLGNSSTLYLNPLPTNGERFGILDVAGSFATYPITIAGNGRLVENSPTLVLNTTGLNREWFYRDDLGTWVRLTNLVESDESPFPREFDDLLIFLLAIRLNPSYGAETANETGQMLSRMRNKFRATYSQTKKQYPELGLIRMSSSKNRHLIFN